MYHTSYGVLAITIYLTTIFVYPHAVPERPRLQTVQESQPITASSPFNITNTLIANKSSKADNPRSNEINCFEHVAGLYPTDIEGCRPNLNIIRMFPNYRLVQEFQGNKKPKKPWMPPWGLRRRGSTCDIQLSSNGDDSIIDKFSYEQIRGLATDIVQECQPPDGAGVGGWAPIGRHIGWIVRVLGMERLNASRADGATMLVDNGEPIDGKLLPLEGNSLDVDPVSLSSTS
ncbi:MAG: hypothetical protein Q9217_005725 [Psora testacea]